MNVRYPLPSYDWNDELDRFDDHLTEEETAERLAEIERLTAPLHRPRRGRAVLSGVFAGALIGTLAWGWYAHGAENLTGYAVAIDGDTLRIGSARVRLAYIDAPESTQTCLTAARTSWACGENATRALRRMLDRDPLVVCQPKGTDRYGRTIAVCANGEGDLGKRMVATGMAIRYERYAGEAYRDEEAAAKAERLGMWAGSFQQPEQYRKEHKR